MADEAFPCTFPVGFRRRLPSTEQSPRGNLVPKFADDDEVFVWGLYLGNESAPGDGHADREAFDATCYPPTSLGVKPGDLIKLPGEEWMTVVRAVSYDSNPDFAPGLADVKLRRVDG